jgi:hypothetical protein
MTGRVKFATSPAPCPQLAELFSNPTPPGQIAREWTSSVCVCLAHERASSFLPCRTFVQDGWIEVAIWPIKWKLMADDYERERYSP